MDPSTPLNRGTLWAQMVAMVPQHLAEGVGLGLNDQDMVSPLRTGLSWFVKRVVPTYIAVEAYKNLNANAHEAHLPGLDDLGANVLANTNLYAAKLKDLTGITHLDKRVVYGLPGLDQFFHPRSEHEYRDYLFYGE